LYSAIRRSHISDKIFTEPEQLPSIQRRKWTYYGHVVRSEGDTLDKDIIVYYISYNEQTEDDLDEDGLATYETGQG